MKKTIYVHTNPANAEKVTAFVTHHVLVDGDKVEPSGADGAVLLKKDKDGNLVGEVVAVVSAGLPNAQDIVAGYRRQGVNPYIIGATAAPAAPDKPKAD